MLQAVGEPSVSPPVQHLACKSHHDAWQVLSYGTKHPPSLPTASCLGTCLPSLLVSWTWAPRDFCWPRGSGPG